MSGTVTPVWCWPRRVGMLIEWLLSKSREG